jgi:hypothetical protein
VQSVVWSIIRFFFITEFQSGGYPHDHGLFWIDNAPKMAYNPMKRSKSSSTNHFILEEIFVAYKFRNINKHVIKKVRLYAGFIFLNLQ